ncbi:hypothetical protein AHAS_Ahas16G0090900 [Arachis hypogaea]
MILIYLQKNYDLGCSTRSIHDNFYNMINDKKAIVQELEFGYLIHIPTMNVPHKLLKELVYSFYLSCYRLDIRDGRINITPENIAVALGLSASNKNLFSKIKFQELSEENKKVVRSFQGKTLSQLSTSMMEMSVDREKNWLKFKKTFILYIQMSFLLLTTVNKLSLVHMPPILHVDTIGEGNWSGHMLNFLI